MATPPGDSHSALTTILWRGRYLIAVSVVATLAATVLVTKLASKVYEASAIVQVESEVPNQAGEVLGLQQASQGLAAAYATLINAPSFIARIQPQVLDGDVAPVELAPRIGAAAVESGEQSTNLISITATALTPEEARMLVNEVAAAFVAVIAGDAALRADAQQAELQERISSLADQIEERQAAAAGAEELAALRAARDALANQFASLVANGVTRGGSISVVAPAVEPGTQISPRLLLNLLAGLAVGLLLGAGLAWIRSRLARHIQSDDEVESLVGLPLIGSIPLNRGRTIDDELAREAYQVLRTNVGFLALGNPVAVMTITSHEPGEGKSSVVEGLGRAASKIGQKVLLIDGDVRTGVLSERLGVADRPGLTNLIVGSDASRETRGQAASPPAVPPNALVEIAPGLSVLPAGAIPPNPASLLASSRLVPLIQTLRKGFDLIVIDSPPVGHLADASLLASASDGAVVVARVGKTKREALQNAVAILSRNPVPVLGVVMFVARSADSVYYGKRERRRKRRLRPQNAS
ncbi:MAG: polysaccharide biosynthesis tyrosine autokinase [Gaiellaceae bacterium MAG52_C11]|nr:polysaccharide biosynthesis tyrosine autokinase [Candidatus Gaiellasilicea maunaloa]